MEKRKDYRVLAYDCFFQNYMWDTESFFETEEQATEYAMNLYYEIDTYNDEIQLYIRTLGMGEWQMFGYITEDENDNPCVEECFC